MSIQIIVNSSIFDDLLLEVQTIYAKWKQQKYFDPDSGNCVMDDNLTLALVYGITVHMYAMRYVYTTDAFLNNNEEN